MVEEKRFSTAEAAERLGVVQRTIQRWYEQGEFPNARPKSPTPRSPIVIPESDIAAFEQRRDAAGPQPN
jgi:excisionase family DNA binding protein